MTNSINSFLNLLPTEVFYCVGYLAGTIYMHPFLFVGTILAGFAYKNRKRISLKLR